MFLAPVCDKAIQFYGRNMMSNKRPHIYTSATAAAAAAAAKKAHTACTISARTKCHDELVCKQIVTWVRKRQQTINRNGGNRNDALYTSYNISGES